MNSVTSHHHPTLHIVPKPARIHLPLRQLLPQQGILWSMVLPVFERQNWHIEESTDLFLKASRGDQSVIISKMGQGTLLVNHNLRTYSVSHLHEIEALADNHQPSTGRRNRHLTRGLLMSLLLLMRVFA